MALTVIIFDETGLEAFQLVARDDCLGLHVYVALKTASNCNRKKWLQLLFWLKLKPFGIFSIVWAQPAHNGTMKICPSVNILTNDFTACNIDCYAVLLLVGSYK